MIELIEEAEKLYKQIDKAQVHLINARLNNDKEGNESAITEIETAMCDASRLLKCFIDRKDNIVDLSEVWHNKETKPDRARAILVDSYAYGRCILTTTMPCSNEKWSRSTSFYAIKRWAYIKDLLPKGGEE